MVNYQLIETFRLAFTANGKPERRPLGVEIKPGDVLAIYELLIRINTLHIDKSSDHRHLLTAVNDFSAYTASRLNCGV